MSTLCHPPKQLYSGVTGMRLSSHMSMSADAKIPAAPIATRRHRGVVNCNIASGDKTVPR